MMELMYRPLYMSHVGDQREFQSSGAYTGALLQESQSGDAKG